MTLPTPFPHSSQIRHGSGSVEDALGIPSNATNLPNPATLGQRSFVTDATLNTFGSLVVGGGTFKVPVYYDGTNWYVG
jgi:hypothetical protein